jgi:hypothetical protein
MEEVPLTYFNLKIVSKSKNEQKYHRLIEDPWLTKLSTTN